MRVQGLGPIDRADSSRGKSTARSKVPKEDRKKPSAMGTDTYEPSVPERGELISQVKKKIGSGYYNTESVLEDLSHGFADIFNKI